MGEEGRDRRRGFFVGQNFGVPVARVVAVVAVACIHRGTGLACGWGCSTRCTCTMVVVSL